MSWLRRLMSYTWAIALGIFTVTFLFTTVGISGDSMAPNLHDGERVFVPKYESWLRRAGVGEYRRGEIVFFRPPVEATGPRLRLPFLNLELPKFYIKRIIGLPGERLKIERGIVYIDGEPLDESFLGEGNGNFESLPELIIPPGGYFVMGDNRRPHGSLDSRRFGSIPEGSIAGRVNFVVWPPFREENGFWQLNLRPLPAPELAR